MSTREGQLVRVHEHGTKLYGKAKFQDFIVLNSPSLQVSLSVTWPQVIRAYLVLVKRLLGTLKGTLSPTYCIGNLWHTMADRQMLLVDSELLPHDELKLLFETHANVFTHQGRKQLIVYTSYNYGKILRESLLWKLLLNCVYMTWKCRKYFTIIRSVYKLGTWWGPYKNKTRSLNIFKLNVYGRRKRE